MKIHWERHKYPLQSGATVERFREIIEFEKQDLIMSEEDILRINDNFNESG